MGIVNRTKDVSEQKDLIVDTVHSGTSTGVTYPIYTAPRAQTITDLRSYCFGLSGAPTSTLKMNRFVSGSGMTVISISGALTLSAFGTSGGQQYSLPAAGSSLLQLQSGDMLFLEQGGSNAAVAKLLTELVVQNVMDIKPWSF